MKTLLGLRGIQRGVSVLSVTKEPLSSRLSWGGGSVCVLWRWMMTGHFFLLLQGRKEEPGHQHTGHHGRQLVVTVQCPGH